MNNLNNVDTASSSVDMRIQQAANLIDQIERNTYWYINRYESKKEEKQNTTYEDKEAIELFGMPQNTVINGNLLLNEGINELWTHICSTGGTKFDNSNSYLGVGDTSTAEAATQTGLSAPTNKLYKAMDATFPTYGTLQKAVWKSTFASADANWLWTEFTVANGNSDTAKNLNRKVSSQGTKQTGQTWELTLEIVLS